MNNQTSAVNWATRLKLRRIATGYATQGDLAAATGDLIAQRTISHLENGSTPLTGLSAPRLAVLARALNWTIEEMELDTGVLLISTEIPTGTQGFFDRLRQLEQQIKKLTEENNRLHTRMNQAQGLLQG